MAVRKLSYNNCNVTETWDRPGWAAPWRGDPGVDEPLRLSAVGEPESLVSCTSGWGGEDEVGSSKVGR